jgi:hypothetical protein
MSLTERIPHREMIINWSVKGSNVVLNVVFTIRRVVLHRPWSKSTAKNFDNDDITTKLCFKGKRWRVENRQRVCIRVEGG